jgi:hypothetical protein
VGEVNCVVVVLKLNVECQRVRTDIAAVVIIEIIEYLMVVSRTVDVIIVISEVSNVLAAPLPSNVIVGGICR